MHNFVILLASPRRHPINFTIFNNDSVIVIQSRVAQFSVTLSLIITSCGNVEGVVKEVMASW